MALPFWQVKSLSEMTAAEWELLCDGCGRCCLKKLELPDGEILYTRVACSLLDIETCRCRSYAERTSQVLTCMHLSSEMVALHTNLLPKSCAYRLIQEGRDLEDWHPLVCGNAQKVHEMGISVQGRVICGDYVHPDDLEELVVAEEDI